MALNTDLKELYEATYLAPFYIAACSSPLSQYMLGNGAIFCQYRVCTALIFKIQHRWGFPLRPPIWICGSIFPLILLTLHWPPYLLLWALVLSLPAASTKWISAPTMGIERFRLFTVAHFVLQFPRWFTCAPGIYGCTPFVNLWNRCTMPSVMDKGPGGLMPFTYLRAATSSDRGRSHRFRAIYS